MDARLKFRRVRQYIKFNIIKIFSEYATDIERKWLKKDTELSGCDVCIFVSYVQNGRVAEDVSYQLQAWKSAGFKIVLVLTVDDEYYDNLEYDFNLVDGLLIRRNKGYDFGAWASAIVDLPTLCHANLLITANDSVIGPLAGFEDFIDRIKKSKYNFTGIVESAERNKHYQSFMLAYDRSILKSEHFLNFWQNIKVGGRDQIILWYELKMPTVWSRHGFTHGALYPARNNSNPTLVYWRELVEAGFPFLKKRLIRETPFPQEDGSWGSYMSRKGCRIISEKIKE